MWSLSCNILSRMAQLVFLKQMSVLDLFFETLFRILGG